MEIITPKDSVGTLMELCQGRRGDFVDMQFLTETRTTLIYELPLALVSPHPVLSSLVHACMLFIAICVLHHDPTLALSPACFMLRAMDCPAVCCIIRLTIPVANEQDVPPLFVAGPMHLSLHAPLHLSVHTVVGALVHSMVQQIDWLVGCWIDGWIDGLMDGWMDGLID